MPRQVVGEEYENVRLENIRRNNDMLRSLGLLTKNNRLAPAPTRRLAEAPEPETAPARKAPKAKKRKRTADSASTRRSRRIRGEKAEAHGMAEEWLERETRRETVPAEVRVEASREAKLRAANEVGPGEAAV